MCSMFGFSDVSNQNNAFRAYPTNLKLSGTIFKDINTRNIALEMEDVLGFSLDKIMKNYLTLVDLKKVAIKLKTTIEKMFSYDVLQYGFSLEDIFETFDDKGSLKDHFSFNSTLWLDFN